MSEKPFVIHIKELGGDRFIGPFAEAEALTHVEWIRKQSSIIGYGLFKMLEQFTARKEWDRV